MGFNATDRDRPQWTYKKAFDIAAEADRLSNRLGARFVLNRMKLEAMGLSQDSIKQLCEQFDSE